jgi:uncharacterized phage-associated protein
MATVSVHDVASYILENMSPMTAMKLQKLVYYCQAWHAVWEEEALFSENIEAWANGPVVPQLYDRHRGQFLVTSPWGAGESANLSESQKESVGIVLDGYGKLNPQQLSDLTHSEDPWKIARNGCPADQRCRNDITLDSMVEFYSSISPQ